MKILNITLLIILILTTMKISNSQAESNNDIGGSFGNGYRKNDYVQVYISDDPVGLGEPKANSYIESMNTGSLTITEKARRYDEIIKIIGLYNK